MTEQVQKHAAAGFLYDSQRKAVLLHLRDGNTKINPKLEKVKKKSAELRMMRVSRSDIILI